MRKFRLTKPKPSAIWRKAIQYETQSITDDFWTDEALKTAQFYTPWGQLKTALTGSPMMSFLIIILGMFLVEQSLKLILLNTTYSPSKLDSIMIIIVALSIFPITPIIWQIYYFRKGYAQFSTGSVAFLAFTLYPLLHTILLSKDHRGLFKHFTQWSSILTNLMGAVILSLSSWLLLRGYRFIRGRLKKGQAIQSL